MRQLVATVLLLCVIGSAFSVKLKVTNDPPTMTPQEAAQKQAAFQAELSKFIEETNKVKLIKWGDYDVYVNQNCPQPPTKPEGTLKGLDPIKNCMDASSDAQEIAKTVAKISADAATQGIPVRNSVKECFSQFTTATTLKLKPNAANECYKKSFDDYFQQAFEQIKAQLEATGWTYNADKQTFEKSGPTVTVSARKL